MQTDGFHLDLDVDTDTNYVVSACADLSNWTPLATNSAPSGSATFLDPNARNYTTRFYKVQTQ